MARGSTWPSRSSRSASARNARSRLAAGGKDPNDAEAQRAHKNKLFLDWHRRMRDLVRAVRPGCQVDFNDIGLACVSQRAALLDNIDIEALPTGAGWGYFYAPDADPLPAHLRHPRLRHDRPLRHRRGPTSAA